MLQNHLHALGLEVNVPTPPSHHVHTVSRHMAKDSNTFRFVHSFVLIEIVYKVNKHLPEYLT